MDQQPQRADEHALRSAWDTRAELRAEFGTFEVFAAFEDAAAQGRTSLPSALSRSAQPDPGAAVSSARRPAVDEEVLRAAWEGRADLHAEFGTFEVFAAFERASEQGRTREPSALLRRRSSAIDERAGGIESTETAATAANRMNAAGLERERQVVAVPLSGPAAAAVNPRGASLAEVALSLRAPVHKLPIAKAEQVLAAVGLHASSREDGELWFDRATVDAAAGQRDVRSRIANAALQHVRELGFVNGSTVAFAS